MTQCRCYYLTGQWTLWSIS